MAGSQGRVLLLIKRVAKDNRMREEEVRRVADREETPIHIWFEENKENFIIPPHSPHPLLPRKTTFCAWHIPLLCQSLSMLAEVNTYVMRAKLIQPPESTLFLTFNVHCLD
jgi:hypothetical protein